jgi:hypothetical protein
MRRMTRLTQARDVGYIQPPMTVKAGKHVAANVIVGCTVPAGVPVTSNDIDMSHRDINSFRKIELKLGDPDLEQIIAFRADEFALWAERQRLEAEARKAKRAARIAAMEAA